MPRQDFTSHRLFVDFALGVGLPGALDRDQANYLINVLRLGLGAEILLFNGRDGEWRARIIETSKRNCLVEGVSQVRDQTTTSDVWYCFAPLKSARLDYIVQKAAEMGSGRILPVLTRHTQVSRLNLDRVRANVIEAAEQCGVISVPETEEPARFDRFLERCGSERSLIFCDEDADVTDPVATLQGLKPGPLAIIIGPEGGFSEEERQMLLTRANTLRLSLGPRILRADTAGVAALALVQAVCGDWRR